MPPRREPSEPLRLDEARTRLGLLTLPAVLVGYAALRAEAAAADQGLAGAVRRGAVAVVLVVVVLLALVAARTLLPQAQPVGPAATTRGLLLALPALALGVLAALSLSRERSVTGVVALLAPLLAVALAMAGVSGRGPRSRAVSGSRVLATLLVLGPPVLLTAYFVANVSDLAVPVALAPLHLLLVRAALPQA